MSDAAEHLAPVSYLPWVAPAEPASEPGTDAGGGATRDREARADRGARHDRGARSRHPAGSARRGRFAIVDDDPDETGAERDERIDRLVVSRLRRSALSVAEVRAVLAEHGLDEAEIEEWIDRYERLGYLDDTRLAEQLVHVSGSRRGRGSGAILQELARRGVGDSAARTAIEALDPEVERDNALAIAERRARQLTGLDRQTAERRLSAFLQRRGYPGDVVREAVTAALSAEGS
ncbi:regulatory protein RecX [Agromyces bauzanensis]